MIYVGTRDDTEFEILDENAVHIQSKSAGERGSELRFRDMIVLSPTDEIVLLTWNGISHVEGVDLLPAMVPDTKSARK
jgi:hypothetical protein